MWEILSVSQSPFNSQKIRIFTASIERNENTEANRFAFFGFGGGRLPKAGGVSH